MWRVTWRDLLYRRRRFVVAAGVTSIAFAVALLLSGVIVAVHAQNERVVERFAADEWWVPQGAGGPFTAGPVVDERTVAELASVPGITRSEGVLLMRTTLSDAGPSPVVDPSDITDVNLVGVGIRGLGMPEVDEGRAIERRGEVILDEELGHDVGDVIQTGGESFRVVGVAGGISYLFGVATMFVSLPDAQVVGAGGERAVSAVVTQGEPDGPVPDGLVGYDESAVIADLNRVVGQGFSAVQTMRVIMMVAALGVVSLIIYLSSLERARDVAVLKATGASSTFVALGLAVQGVLVTAVATGVAVVVARVLEPMFPLRLELTGRVHVELAVLALVSGLLASAVGIRRVLTVDPAMAFE